MIESCYDSVTQPINRVIVPTETARFARTMYLSQEPSMQPMELGVLMAAVRIGQASRSNNDRVTTRASGGNWNGIEVLLP